MRPGGNGPVVTDSLLFTDEQLSHSSRPRRLPWPARLACAPLEALFSNRGLGLLVLLMAALLVYGGWLRPPLSPDVRTLYVPLGAWKVDNAPKPEELLMEPKGVPPDSLGLLLFGLLALGALVVLWEPKWTGAVCGLLLAAVLCGNLVLLNHPRLVELMDLEYAQRWQMVTAVGRTPVISPLTSPFNGRIIGQTGLFGHDEVPGDPGRSVIYLDFGRWLIPLAIVGCLLGTQGKLRRRVIVLVVWCVVGLSLSGLAFARRCYAEFYWLQAVRQESLGELEMARQSARESLAAFPELKQLERTWRFLGKLDYDQGRPSRWQRYFLAFQLNRDQEIPRGVTAEEDIEWEPLGISDYREETHPVMTGPYMDISPSVASAHNFDIGLSQPAGFDARGYAKSHYKERRTALDWMERLMATGDEDESAVRQQAARFWTELGLSDYPGASNYTDSGGLIFYTQNRALGSTHFKWRRALEIEPLRHDCPFYLGLSQGRVDLARPELASDEFARIKHRLADRILRAELLDSLGDAFFEAGRINEATRLYAESMDIFSLPKLINYRGQKALGGL